MLCNIVRRMASTAASSTSSVTPEKYWLLMYSYVPNIIEKRAPYRSAHLELVGKYKDEGTVILGGAFANPPDGAAIIFKGVQKEVVEDFTKKDPYVINKLVTSFQIREWTVVVKA